MANRKVTLVRLCKTENGWRRYPVVVGKNGRVSPGMVRVGTEKRHYPEGRYQLRTYEGSKMRYTDIGDDAAEALNQQTQTKRVLLAKETAKEAGVKVVEPEQRKKLRTELKKFYEAGVAKGAEYSAGVNKKTVEEFLDVCGIEFVDEVKGEHITKFQAALRKRELADRTVANLHNRVCAFLRYMKLDVKDLAPATPGYEEPLPEIYTDAELQALLSGVEDERMLLAFELLLKSGMREGEAIHLSWTMVNFERGYIRVRSNPEWGFKVKDKEQRDIPLSPDMMEKLRAWKEKRGGKLVIGSDRNLPETKLLRRLKTMARDLGLNCGECAAESTKTVKGKNGKKEKVSVKLHCSKDACCEKWFLHKFRATYTTKMLRSGMDLRTTMRLTGHSDLESVMRYLSPATDEDIQEHVRTMVWIGEPKTSTRRADAAQPRRRSSPGRSARSSRSVSRAAVRT